MRWNLAVAALSASFGFVSILVAGIDLDAPVLVFYRCLFAVPAIALALLLTRRLFVLRRGRTLKAALLLGTTLGVALLAPVVLPERRSRIALVALMPAAGGLAIVALAGGDDVDFRPLALLTGLGTALT